MAAAGDQHAAALGVGLAEGDDDGNSEEVQVNEKNDPAWNATYREDVAQAWNEDRSAFFAWMRRMDIDYNTLKNWLRHNGRLAPKEMSRADPTCST